MATMTQRIEEINRRNAALVGTKLSITNGPGATLLALGIFVDSSEIPTHFTIPDHPDKRPDVKDRKGWTIHFHMLRSEGLCSGRWYFEAMLERAKGRRWFTVKGTYSVKKREGTLMITDA